MMTFEQFTTSLGEHAKHYTTEQLQELHIEVRQLANVLLQIRDAKLKEAHNPQPTVDASRTDRTIERELTAHHDGPDDGRQREPTM